MMNRRALLTNLLKAAPALAVLPFVGQRIVTQHGQAAHPIRPGDLLIKRDDGLLYPFNHAHPFAGVATGNAGVGECVEYVEARQ